MTDFSMPTTHFMSSPVIQVDMLASLADAERILEQRRISSAAVVHREKLVGVISRTDLIRLGRQAAGRSPKSAILALPDVPLAEVMTKHVVCVSPRASVTEAAAEMIAARVHRVFVSEGAQLRGVLSTKDVMRAVAEERVAAPIASLMRAPVFSVRADEPLSLAGERLERAQVSGVVVLDGRLPVGLFTQSEALAAANLPRDTPVEVAMSPALLCLPPDTPVHRAAAQAAATRARSVLVTLDRQIQGIVTGSDFLCVTQ